MSIPAREFHFFPKLPTELREQIWLYCLPERVCELDIPLNHILLAPSDEYWKPGDSDGPWPCEISHTMIANSLPPLISRVCYESRAVAFKAGGIMPDSRGGHFLGEEWYGLDVHEGWQDLTRDSVHLNWTATCEADYGFSDGSPLHCLAWAASNVSRGGSLTFAHLENFHRSICVSLQPGYYDKQWDHFLRAHSKSPTELSMKTTSAYDRARLRAMDALQRQSSWRVVMQVIVVHTNAKTATESNLFGLLSDARVQIVDISEEGKMASFFEFAEQCERKGSVTVPQDFRREPADSMKQRLRCVIMKQFNSKELAAKMHPAIMFRLCTRMCNHLGFAHRRSGTRWDRERPSRGRRPGFTRGRGRGRGM